jgi:hypothetical protein
MKKCEQYDDILAQITTFPDPTHPNPHPDPQHTHTHTHSLSHTHLLFDHVTLLHDAQRKFGRAPTLLAARRRQPLAHRANLRVSSSIQINQNSHR